MRIMCGYPEQQVAFALRIHLIFGPTWDSHTGSTTLSRTLWRKFLRLFSNVKVLQVKADLVRVLSRSLHSGDGESPLELLPHLEELTDSGGEIADAFTPFIDERQAAGHPVGLRPLFDGANRAMCQWHRPVKSKCYEELE
jgi:hypothetical protein